ncbi:hypothetical protein ES692_10895 [Psychroserpens burtonensis]|uniref:Uncharacterized protein n=1 Tax=Psychroserpens burtonensis TaxID=49278 RepID=A0A5C7B592_9FLAO|nr:hypothetical protein [Psychroserpens burtonensis]TXE16858.1 hypothetical protein ES692_10895 [Psychroserpens burtonensis]
MGATALKNKILQLINTDNVNHLKAIIDFAEKQKEENDSEIVAYTVNGDSLTKEEYVNRVKEADASITHGEYTTVEDLEKEVKKWKYDKAPILL